MRSTIVLRAQRPREAITEKGVCRRCMTLLLGVVRQWRGAVLSRLMNDGDGATAPKSLLKLPVLFVGVRRPPERKAVLGII